MSRRPKTTSALRYGIAGLFVSALGALIVFLALGPHGKAPAYSQTAAASSGAARAAATIDENQEAVPALVDTDWLAANLEKPDLRILDLRGNRRVFQSGRIPGAILSGYGRAGWLTTRDGVPGMLPEMAALERIIGGFGISNAHHVVLVAAGTDPTNIGIATRIFWTFKVAGHTRVSLLNGGHEAYKQSGHRLAKGRASQPQPEAFKARFQRHLLATEDDVKQALSARDTLLLDNRPEWQFSGAKKVYSVARHGTVPNALNVATLDMTVDGSGVIKTNDALKALHAQHGARTEGKIIAFCNTGHWASTGWFVLHELLGNKQARLYDGSMSEWSLDDTNPMVITSK